MVLRAVNRALHGLTWPDLSQINLIEMKSRVQARTLMSTA